ncbi:hypothetical protein KM043_000916 [Ampulex compressa]|nr:hypothetical protein KM043_000916 [Ampulex compressa]
MPIFLRSESNGRSLYGHKREGAGGAGRGGIGGGGDGGAGCGLPEEESVRRALELDGDFGIDLERSSSRTRRSWCYDIVRPSLKWRSTISGKPLFTMKCPAL